MLEDSNCSTRKRAKEITIRVGTCISQKVFRLESGMLCGDLAFVHSDLENPLASSRLKEVELPDEDPIAAEMFIEWAKRPKQPILYVPGQYSDEPWMSNAAAAWLLGHRLDEVLFQTYALSQFFQNCASAVRGPWRLIEEKAPAQSPLLRFSDHWVAWNSSLCGSGPNEYTGLNAAKHADQVKPCKRDPRTLDLNL